MMTTSQPMILPDSRLQVYEDTEEAPSPNNRSHLNLDSSLSHASPFKGKSKLSQRVHSAKKSNAKDDKMLVSLQIKENFFLNHHMPFMTSPHDTLQALSRQQIDVNAATHDSGISSHRQLQHSPQNVVTMSPRYQMKKPDSLSILAVNEHKTHNQWLRRIRKLWDKILNECNYDEIGRVEQELKEGQKKLRGLEQENMRINAKSLDTQHKAKKQMAKKRASKSI